MIEKLNIYSNTPEVINKINEIIDTVNNINKEIVEQNCHLTNIINTSEHYKATICDLVPSNTDKQGIISGILDTSKIENIAASKANISDLKCSSTSIDSLNRA
jgi:hypothetical protein